MTQDEYLLLFKKILTGIFSDQVNGGAVKIMEK